MVVVIGGHMKLKINKAKDGKVWKSKIDGAILSDQLILGKDDSLDNYEQIDIPNDDEE